MNIQCIKKLLRLAGFLVALGLAIQSAVPAYGKDVNVERKEYKENNEIINKKNIKDFFIKSSKFVNTHEFSEGLAAVKVWKNGKLKWGFIDENGNMVIDPDYDWASPFSEGLATVGVGEKYGYINKENVFVINPIYDFAKDFQEGRACVYDRTKKKSGYIDKNGTLVIDFLYENIQRGFSEGVVAVQSSKNGRLFFIDAYGSKLSENDFYMLGDLSEGLANFFDLKKNKSGYVNKNGKIIIDAKYDYASDFSENLAAVRIGDEVSGKWGFIDKSGKFVITPQFLNAGSFASGLAAVMVGSDQYGGKWGFINNSGKFIINPKFTSDSFSPKFSEGYARVCIDKKITYDGDNVLMVPEKCGLINTQGKFVIEPEFEQNYLLSDLKNGFMRVSVKYLEEEGFVSLKKQNKNLNVTITEPDENGEFQLKIYTYRSTASLKINGEEQGASKEGTYHIRKIAKAGHDTRLDIVAKDVYGNTETKTVTVSRPVAESKPLVAALNPAQVKKQPERDAVAVIIGIADYKNLPRADYANDDARVFYDYAIRALGVKPENIRLLVDGDADQAEIYRAFKTWLPSRVRAGTDVYVFYSGHGLPTADGKGLYVLPQRADRDFIDKTAITQAEINAAIQATKPRSVTMFLDACYSGQARTGETLLASARPVALKVERQLFPDSFTVISASQADQISSSSPDLKHGIFSYYLMRGMEGDADANRDGRITVGEMHGYLTEQVTRQAGMMNRQQVPQLVGDANRVLVGR